MSGQADPAAVSVETGYRRACEYDTFNGLAYVPARLRVAAHVPQGSASESSVIEGAGWVTLHVTATVTSRRGGHTTLTSATQDIPINVGTRTTFASVDVPLDAASWRPGSTDCFITEWTMTPGAWFGTED